MDIYYPVYNPHPYFTDTCDHIGAVRAWPNTNVTSHKLTLKPGYHILCMSYFYVYWYIFLCCRYLQLILDVTSLYLWVVSKLFELFTHLALIVSMKTQTVNYIIYNVVILDN